MEIERVSFSEAIKIVAENRRAAAEDDRRRRFEARKRESDQVIELNQWALQWWQDQLQSKAAPRSSILEAARPDGRNGNDFRSGLRRIVGRLFRRICGRKGDAGAARASGLVVKEGRRRLVRSFSRPADVSGV
jgi:DNA primase